MGILSALYLLALAVMLVSCNRPSPETDSIVTGDPLERLMLGNKRFVKGRPVHPDETLERIRNLKKGQNPFVVIVSCSDSRVPPELLFDHGFGDVFSIRTAGNVIGDYELGSVEYAVEHLGCRLVLCRNRLVFPLCRYCEKGIILDDCY